MRRTLGIVLLVFVCSVGVIISVTAASPATPTPPKGTFPPVPPFRGCVATPIPSPQAGKVPSTAAAGCHTQPDGRSVFDQGTTTVAIVGAPAITPSKPTNDPSTPAFTEADVRAYMNTHSTGVKITTIGMATVSTVTFGTAQSVDQSLHTHLDLSPSRLLCVVEMKGSFQVDGPKLPSDVQTRVASHKTTQMYFIYDAHTGNFIAEHAGN